jgi:integrase
VSVRKRKWTTRRGEVKEAWLVDYVDQQKKRHQRTFDKKRKLTGLQRALISRCAKERM